MNHSEFENREPGTSPRAAQYVRMSTEHQQYSTENQARAIEAYAAKHNFQIVRTYEDSGKSGLRLNGRSGLKQLIEDIEAGRKDFESVLVYDISRWGRFQDCDESAFYEFRCRRSGVQVRYCAEQFENDGSIGSDIQKVVKRRMAAEYSRELSVKVFGGQANLIEKGFRQGGRAGYGLRRVLLDSTGKHKGTLSIREQKSIQTDRVILVPGHPDELDVIRAIYTEFVDAGRNEVKIAQGLNSKGLRTDQGTPWTRASVHQILTNEKYVGNNVWNRRSFKLRQHRIRNEPERWIRADNAFEAIVDRSLFEQARRIIFERSCRMSAEEMLSALRAILTMKGALSGLLIDEAEGCPSSSVYRARFGGLLRTYRLIGYDPSRDYAYLEINRLLRAAHASVVTNVIEQLEDQGNIIERSADSRLLIINGEFTTSVVLGRHTASPSGCSRWTLRFDAALCPDMILGVRMDVGNKCALDYYLLPFADMSSCEVRLQENNEAILDTYRFDNLSALRALAKRTALREVA